MTYIKVETKQFESEEIQNKLKKSNAFPAQIIRFIDSFEKLTDSQAWTRKSSLMRGSSYRTSEFEDQQRSSMRDENTPLSQMSQQSLIKDLQQYKTKLQLMRIEDQRKNDEITKIKSHRHNLENALKNKDNEIANLQIQIQQKSEIIQKNGLTIQFITKQRESLLSEITELKHDNSMFLERIKKDHETISLITNELNIEIDDARIMKEQLQYEQKAFQEKQDDVIQLLKELKNKGQPTPPVSPSLSDFLNLPPGYVIPHNDSNMPQNGKKISKLHQNQIYSIVQNLNGTLIVTAGGDRAIQVFDPISQTTINTITSEQSDQFYISLSMAHYSGHLLAGSSDNQVHFLSLNSSSSKSKQAMMGHADKVTTVSFLCEKEQCVSGSLDRTLKFWDLNKFSSFQSVGCSSGVTSMESFISDPHLFTGHKDRSIRMYSSRESHSQPIYEFQNMAEQDINMLKLSPNELYLIFGSREGNLLSVMDTRTHQILQTFSDKEYLNNHEYNQVCFGPHTETIIAGNCDGTILIWDFLTGKLKEHKKNTGHQGVVICTDFHNATRNLFSADSRGNLVIWNI